MNGKLTGCARKPHVVTHSHQQFVDTKVTGTLALLEAAADAGVGAFVQTGDALHPAPSEPAAWIDEDVRPLPKNIYGATKLAAEHLCRVVARTRGLPVIVLRTSRFFPEEDDNAAVRQSFAMDNIQALEMLYRRGDIEDMATAHLAAIERAVEIGFGLFIVSATTASTTTAAPARRWPGNRCAISATCSIASPMAAISAASWRWRSARRATTRGSSPQDPTRSSDSARTCARFAVLFGEAI